MQQGATLPFYGWVLLHCMAGPHWLIFLLKDIRAVSITTIQDVWVKSCENFLAMTSFNNMCIGTCSFPQKHVNPLGGLGHSTLKQAAFPYSLFWAEGTWETGTGRTAWPPRLYLKSGHKISHEKEHSLHQEENVPETGSRHWNKLAQTNLLMWPLSPTSPSPGLLIASPQVLILTLCLVISSPRCHFYLKRTTALC